MRPRRLLIALTAAALLAPAAGARAADCPGADLQPDATNTVQVAQATLCLINDQRAANGLAPLTLDGALTAASDAYAEQLVTRQFFDHTTPDGVTLAQRLKLAGYDYTTAGENLAWGSGPLAPPAAIVDAWMHSDGHRRNILDPDFKEIGFGLALGAPVSTDLPAATYVTDFGTQPAVNGHVATPIRTAASSRTARAAAKPRHRKLRRHHRRHHRRHLRSHR